MWCRGHVPTLPTLPKNNKIEGKDITYTAKYHGRRTRRRNFAAKVCSCPRRKFAGLDRTVLLVYQSHEDKFVLLTRRTEPVKSAMPRKDGSVLSVCGRNESSPAPLPTVAQRPTGEIKPQSGNRSRTRGNGSETQRESAVALQVRQQSPQETLMLTVNAKMGYNKCRRGQ